MLTYIFLAPIVTFECSILITVQNIFYFFLSNNNRNEVLSKSR